MRINPYRLFVGSFIPNWLLEQDTVGPGAKLCYARLCQHYGNGKQCNPGQDVLAKELGVSERTVRNYIEELTKCGLIEVEQNGLRKTNCYHFLRHEWMSGREAKIAVPERQESSGQERQESSGPCSKGSESHEKRESVSAQSLEIYNLYPKHAGKKKALQAIAKALEEVTAEELKSIVSKYAKAVRGTEQQFIPHPATWFNQGRWEDDPATWKRSTPGQPAEEPKSMGKRYGIG